MPNLNNCIFMGHLTRSPDLKYLPAGTAVCEFSIAVNRKWTTDTGEKREEVTFVDCKAWAKRAEVMAEHFKKGDPIYVETHLAIEQWEKDGSKHSRARFIVDNFQFLSSRPGSTSAPDENDPARPPRSAPKTPHDPALYPPQDDGDQIPL